MTYALSPWHLDDLFPGHASLELESAFEEVEKKVSAFEQCRPELKPDLGVERFLEILRELESLSRVGYRMYAFANLLFSSDTQNQDAQTLLGRIQQFFAGIGNRTLFFSLWWKDLEQANADRLIKESGDYRYYLEEMRHFKPHTLTEAEEKVVNIKNVTGAEALNTLRDTLTNRYTFKIEVDGQVRELTEGELFALVSMPDADLRARAYQELYRVYTYDAPIIGQIYQSLLRDWHNENVSLRKFSSPIAARNLRNDIPDDVVGTLLDVSRRNVPVFQRFFRLKAKEMGMKRLRRYDLYAPVSQSAKNYSFDEAANMVLESFTQFDPRVGTLAMRVLDDAHLDSEVRKGKRGGAFCYSVEPALTPWVLVNYQGRAYDVATLAHELGHAIHAMLAEHHSLFTFHSSLPLAETASTFGEMMLVDRLLAHETDPAVRRDMLFRQVDDAYMVIMRQAFFAMFERQAHEMVMNNATVTELAEAYRANMEEQFGDSLEISEEFKWEWVVIPHFYSTPFYVYAYAFGQLLVLALYQQYKAEGEAFKPRYLKILAAGGSEAPEKILADAGIDIHSTAFWQGGFDIIAGLVDQLVKG
jgi:oligoendopeptidase F